MLLKTVLKYSLELRPGQDVKRYPSGIRHESHHMITERFLRAPGPRTKLF